MLRRIFRVGLDDLRIGGLQIFATWRLDFDNVIAAVQSGRLAIDAVDLGTTVAVHVDGVVDGIADGMCLMVCDCSSPRKVCSGIAVQMRCRMC